MSAVYSDPVPLALSLVSFSAFSALLFRTCMQRVPAPNLYIPVACIALVASTTSYAVEAIVKYAAPNSRKTFRAATPSGEEGNLPPASQQIIAFCHAITAVGIQLCWTSWMLAVRQRSIALQVFLLANALAHATILAVTAASTSSAATLLRPNAGSPPFSQLADFVALYRVVLMLIAIFVLAVIRGRRLASIALVSLVYPVFSDVITPYIDRGSVPTLVVDAMAISSTIAMVAVTVGIPKHGWNDDSSSADVAYLVKPTRTTVNRSNENDAHHQDPSTLPFARRSSLFEIGNEALRISIHPPTRHSTLNHPAARPLSTAVVTPSPPQTPRATHPKQDRSLPDAAGSYPCANHTSSYPCSTCQYPPDSTASAALAQQDHHARRPSGSNLGVKFAGDRGWSEIGPLQVIAVESPTYSSLAQAQSQILPQAPPPVLSALPRPPSFSPPETLQHQYQQQQEKYPTLNLPAATPTYQQHHLDDGYDDAEVVVIMSDESGSDHDHEPLGMLPSLGGSRRPSGGATTLSINSRTSSLSRPMSPTTAAVAARLTRHLSEVGIPTSPASTASFALLGSSTVGVDPMVISVESEVGNRSEIGNRSRLSSMIDSQLLASEVTLADVGRLSAQGARHPGPPTSESVRAVVSGWPEYNSSGPSPSGDQHQPASQHPRGSIGALSSTQSSPTSAVTLFHSHSTNLNPQAPTVPPTVVPSSVAAVQRDSVAAVRDSLILPADALTVSVPVPPSLVISSTSSADRYVPMSSEHTQPPFETVASMYRNSLTRNGNRHVSRTLSINGRSPMSSLSRRSSEAGSSVVAIDPARLPLPDSDSSSSSSSSPVPPHRKSISSPPTRLSVNTKALPPRQRSADSPYTASSLSRHSSEEADDLIIDPVALTRGSVILAHSPRTSIMSSSSNDDHASAPGGTRRASSSSAGSVPMSSASRTRTPSVAMTPSISGGGSNVSPLGGSVPRTSSPLAVSAARTLVGEEQSPHATAADTSNAAAPPASPHNVGASNRASYMSGYQAFDTLTRGSMAWVSVPSELHSPASPVPPTCPSSDEEGESGKGGGSVSTVAQWATPSRGPTTHVYVGLAGVGKGGVAKQQEQMRGSLQDQIIPSPSTGVEFATTPPEHRT